MIIETRARVSGIRPSNEARSRAGELTWKSLQAMRLRAVNTETPWASLLLLTYPHEWPGNGSQVKADLNRLLTLMRPKFPGLRYLWFLEFQARGAPHVHLLCNHSLPHPRVTYQRRGKQPAQVFPPWEEWLREAWRASILRGGIRAPGQLIVGWEAIRDPEWGAKYATSYATKPTQKCIPEGYQDVGRWWGSDYGTSRIAHRRVGMTNDELLAALGGPRETAWGQWHRVLYGAADALRAYVARRDAPSLPVAVEKVPEGRSGCQCPACRQSRRAWQRGGD